MIERMQILERIENGEIDVEQGLRLLQVLPEGDDADLSIEAHIPQANEQSGKTSQYEDPSKSSATTTSDANQHPAETQRDIPPEAWKWKHWWTVPMWIGLGVAALGGLLMYQAYWIWGFGFWMLCGTIAFLAGLAIVLLAWISRNAPWFHLRVERKAGDRPRRISLSFPIPVRPLAWFLRTFGSYISDLERLEIDEFLLALGETTKPANPIYIQTNPGQGGELVEIFIG